MRGEGLRWSWPDTRSEQPNMPREYVINNTVEFLTQLKSQSEFMIFRGQSRGTWPLLPSIARHYDVTNGYESWQEFEGYFLEEFKKFSVPYLKREPTSRYEWLII